VKDEKPPTNTINARCEEAPASPVWRDAVTRQRCLVPVTGWYEWTPTVDPETGEVRMKRGGKENPQDANDDERAGA